jgi:uncharacterized protein (DUF488 family)
MSKTSNDPLRVWTVGHSIRGFEELVTILHDAAIELLVDVRTVPKSRRVPHFNREALETELPSKGVRYMHMPRLGGFRRAVAGSPNTAWRNASFRGFADYMLTMDFDEALDDLCVTADRQRTAIMCSEAVPWRCHRSLIADALTARGAAVTHLLGHKREQPHSLTSFAAIEGERVTYPGAEEQLALPVEP